MLESLKSNELEYTRLTPEEMKSRGILGRLVGVIADFKNPTRNGRVYKEKLWEKLFEDPIMKERIENRCCFGELCHPESRTETDLEKVAICLAEVPKKDKSGCLRGVFDILDTPNGRLLKTLCDYGCKIGVSSRGNGDIIYDSDGSEMVDPDTYTCEGWDAVIIPAVKNARPQYVKESLSTMPLKTALIESLQKENDKGRAIVESTLKELHIDVEPTDQKLVESIDATKESIAADNDGAIVITELQESLKKNREYEGAIKALQENLSVCYTKERELEEQISRLKRSLQSARDVASRADSMSTKLDRLSEQLQEQNETINAQRTKISSLQEKLVKVQGRGKELNESLGSKSKEIETLTSKIKSLNESLSRANKESKEREIKLNEQVEELKKDSTIKSTEYRAKLASANKLIEKYQKIARVAVDKYIDSQAVKLGVKSSDIRNRLRENYSFDDIDKVCDDLKTYKLNMNSLPFELKESVKQGKVGVNHKKDPLVKNPDVDDEVDDLLIYMTQH